MNIKKAVLTLERRRDWLIKKAQSKQEGPYAMYVQEACVIQLAIEVIQEKMVDLAMSGQGMNFKYFHPELEALKTRMSNEHHAFAKMESNTI